MKFILKLSISTISVFVTARLVPGVDVPDFLTAFVVAVVLGVLNTFIKPLITILTLPINMLTLGLFSFVINVALIMLAAYLVDGFTITTIWAGLLFGLVMSFISSFLNMLAK